MNNLNSLWVGLKWLSGAAPSEQEQQQQQKQQQELQEARVAAHKRQIIFDKLVEIGVSESDTKRALNSSDGTMKGACTYLLDRMDRDRKRKERERRRQKRELEERRKVQRLEQHQVKRHDNRRKVTAKSQDKIVRRANRENVKFGRHSQRLNASLDMQKRKNSRKNHGDKKFRFKVEEESISDEEDVTMVVAKSDHSTTSNQLPYAAASYENVPSEEENMNNNQDDDEDELSEEEEEEEVHEPSPAPARTNHLASTAVMQKPTTSVPILKQPRANAEQKKHMFALARQMTKKSSNTRDLLPLLNDLKRSSSSDGKRLHGLGEKYKTGAAAQIVALLQEYPTLLQMATKALETQAETSLGKEAIL